MMNNTVPIRFVLHTTLLSQGYKEGLKENSGEEQIDNPPDTNWIPRIARFHFMLTVTLYILGHLIVTWDIVVKMTSYVGRY